MVFWRIKMEIDKFDKLIQTHGQRIKPNELMQQRALKNVRSHWQESLVRKRKQRNFRVIGMAASLFVIVGMVVLLNANTNNPINTPFFSDQYVQGELLISSDGENWKSNNGESLTGAKWLKTSADSYASVTLSDNSQLRVNQNTVINVINPLEINLLDGEIYIDADKSTEKNRLVIKTPQGIVRHIGTRYLVKMDQNKLLLAVRNGLVELKSDNLKQQINAGKKLNFDKGEIIISPIANNDNLWKWTLVAAEPFMPNGQSLNDFIVWYAHENGYKINWNANEVNTKRVKLSGELSKLNKSQQLKAVFLSTKFNYEINKGILSIL